MVVVFLLLELCSAGIRLSIRLETGIFEPFAHDILLRNTREWNCVSKGIFFRFQNANLRQLAEKKTVVSRSCDGFSLIS